MTELGTKDSPFTHAPENWNSGGIPYGAWCKCSKCGLVHRSTVSFDCYADGPGGLMSCENCKMGREYMPPAAREEFEGKLFGETAS